MFSYIIIICSYKFNVVCFYWITTIYIYINTYIINSCIYK
uniref:Uncharacterized protein n=1 Tax=Myoviridae sp. ctCL221 TaxID=2826630 RepID=A0A8S5M6D8_9CAUD|nr:MAG TPA: hypothetical protein [Myoviridae sp. ctCL221]